MGDSFSNFLRLIRKNGALITFALLVGAFSVAPNFLATREIGNDYKGIPFIYTNNEDYYMARIQEIADGYPFVASPYFYEYKNLSPLVPPTGEYFYYALSKFLFISVPEAIVLAKFLFPALLFLLVFKFIYQLLPEENTSRKLTAIMGGLFITLGYDLIDYNLLFSRLGGSEQEILSIWTRPVNPITGALILFAFLILVLSIIEEKKGQYTPFIAGILLALSVGYFFAFGIIVSILASLFIIFVIKRNANILKKLTLVIFTGAILDSIYWLSIWKTVASGGEELALRNGMLLSHDPIFNKVLIAATILFILVSIYLHHVKRLSFKEPRFLFLVSLLLSGFIVFNEQIVTGKTIWPYHFVQYTIPISIVTSLIILFILIETRFPKLWKGTATLSIILIISFGIWNIDTYKYAVDDFRHLQKYGEIFSWINKNAASDSVFMVREEAERLTRLIPAFTSSNVYVTTYLSNTMPRERISHSYYMKLRLNEVKPEIIEEHLIANEQDARNFFYTDWEMMLPKGKDLRILPILDEIAKTYKQEVKKDFKTELKKYRLDFIITENTPDLEFKKILPTAEKVFETDIFRIYKI